MSDQIMLFLFIAVGISMFYNGFKMMANLDEDYKDDHFKILFTRFPFAEYFTEEGLKYRRRLFWSWAVWGLACVVWAVSKIVKGIMANP